MTGKPLEFHPEAEQEYLEALAWYRERSPTAALSFERSFDRARQEQSEMLPIVGRFISPAAEDTHSTNFHSSLYTRPSLLILSFWQTPMATVVRATGKTAYDVLKAPVAMLATDGVA